MLRSPKTFPVVLAVLIGAVVIAAGLFFTVPRSAPVYTDAETIHASKDIARIRDILWQPPTWLGETLNSDADEYEPALSPDGLTLLFVRGRPGEGADLYQSIRTPEGWTDPEPLAALNTEYDELGPAFTPEGDGLYFYSDRPGTLGGYDIWYVERTDGAWGEPRVLGAGVNSVYNDYGPAVSPDGVRFYFASNRPRDPGEQITEEHGRWPATVRESFQNRPYDIYHAEVTERGIGEAVLNTDLSSAFSDGAPEVSPVNDFVYFASDRPGGEGGFDLYRARLVDGEFFPVEHLGDGVNTAFNELDPTLAMGGFGLAFSSDRIEGEDADRDYNLFRTESREVYRQVETLAARMTLADFLRIVVPWILLLLLLLGLLALLRKITTDEKWKARWRRLGLLAKCIIVSGLLHMLLLALLTVWQVSNNLKGLFNTPGGSKVTLVSSAVGGGAISQIRGEVSSSVQSESLDVASSEAVMELTYTPVFDGAIDSELTPTTVRDEVTARPIEIASAMPSRETPSEHEQPTPVQPSDLALEMPESARRAAVSESQVASDQAETIQQTTTTSAPLELSDASSQLTSEAPSLEAMNLASSDLAAVNPVSIESGGSPARDPLQEMEAIELASSSQPVSQLDLPQSEGEQRHSEETLLAASPSIMSPDSSEAEIKLGGSAPSDQMDDVALEVAEDAIEHENQLASSQVSRQYEEPASLSVDTPVLVTDFSVPGEVGAEDRHQEQESLVEIDDIAGSLSTDEVALELASQASENLREESLAMQAIELEDNAPTIDQLQPVRSEPRVTDTFADETVAALSFDLDLPAEIAMPEQVAIERHFSGVVLDDVTNAPVEGALVRIDSDQGDLVETRTDERGVFILEPEFDSDFVAVTASRPGYAPHALNLPIAELERGVVREIRLRPIENAVISIEDEPVVHHLGDNAFGGRINSQFQKDSEGIEFSANFELTEQQEQVLGEVAWVTLLAKGLQANNSIHINGHRVRTRLSSSPRDGSFGVFVAPFPGQWLGQGENEIEIRSHVSSGSDHDDFEIVNVQIRLTQPEPEVEAPPSRSRNTL